MKEIFKIIIYTGIIFAISTIIITLWYIIKIGDSVPNIGFNSVMNIILRYGFIGALLPSFFFISIKVFTKIIKNKWILSLAIIFLVILLIIAALQFFWYFVVSGLIKSPFID